MSRQYQCQLELFPLFEKPISLWEIIENGESAHMLELSRGLEPALLLEYETIPRSTEMNIVDAIAASTREAWDEVATIANNARSRWARTGDWLSLGILMMHIGDAALRAGQLSKAEYSYRCAHHRFHLRVDPAQRQNEAASAYGLALTDLQTGHKAQALDRLEEAIVLFKKAEIHWIAIHSNYDKAIRCKHAAIWLEILAQRLLAGYTTLANKPEAQAAIICPVESAAQNGRESDSYTFERTGHRVHLEHAKMPHFAGDDKNEPPHGIPAAEFSNSTRQAVSNFLPVNYSRAIARPFSVSE